MNFVVVPQWQGSASPRALRLIDGAEAIRGDLPRGSTRSVGVPLGAGDAKGTGVLRCSTIELVRDRTREVLRDLDGPSITIGGDCGVELAAVAHADDAAVLWFDAHPDLNTPESSPSGAFTGMVLRTLLGEGANDLLPTHPISPGQVVLAGTRSFDQDEDDYIARTALKQLGDEAIEPDAVVASLETIGASRVYIHIDLDVLDPGQIESLTDPQPFGMSTAALIAVLRAVTGRFALAGAGVTAFAPATPQQAADDLPTILRIIGALAR